MTEAKGNRGRGRPKGSKNKVTRDIKQAVLQAFEEGGGVEYLKTQMTENPTAFLTLLGKIIPTQITGPNDGPVQIEAINVVRDLDDKQLASLVAALERADGSEDTRSSLH